jgi:hypothetical protein
MDRLKLIDSLRKGVRGKVRLSFSDGEVLVARLDLVLEDEDAVVFDMLASNRPDKYEKSDKLPHIFARIAEITSCERVEERGRDQGCDQPPHR